MKVYLVLHEDDAGLAGITEVVCKSQQAAEKWIHDATKKGGEYDYMRDRDFFWIEERDVVDI